MKKRISVVALDKFAGASYAQEIENLFKDYADISMFSVMDGSAAGRLDEADLFVISTDAYGSAEEVARHVPLESQTMAIEVSFRWRELRKLKSLPGGTRALFVNMTEAMAREAIAQLEQFGINHIKWLPFYPGAVLSEKVDLAVTPGETRYVPEEISHCIDLGQRAPTSGMMIEIALRLGLEFLLETPPFKEYFEEIATSNYSFDRMFAKSIRLESQFHILMETLYDGVIGVNEKNEVFAINSIAKRITNTAESQIIGQRADRAFPTVPFAECLRQKRTVVPQVQKINGANISVEVVPVLRQRECIGAFAILQRFNEVEIRQSELRRQMSGQGLHAKYTLEDIIGESEAIKKAKHILKRMAMSESPVLLIGETGTGKELFANALHRASGRSREAFVAINVAAVPENLLESELFGYEDGAFTGAKKGGKQGLFELAHRGTLFLDEVEGMSMALQVKLLRVLQEKEIMRVGGGRIISIDVRVVAATNESLERMVEEGSFRRDLYYRLNTLPLLIPPLSKRGDDMFLLMEAFKKRMGADFVLSDEIKSFFLNYSWPGNIRELQNIAEYFAFTDKKLIGTEELPPTVLTSLRRNMGVGVGEETCQGTSEREGSTEKIYGYEEENGYYFVMKQLFNAMNENRFIGREKLYHAALEAHMPMTQKEIRDILKRMEKQGICVISRGRGGSRMTKLGRDKWLKWLN